MEHELVGNGAIKRFVMAGNAIFTIYNSTTNGRFTYKVSADKEREGFYYVSVLSGPSNTSDYTYVGIIRAEQFMLTRGSKVTEAALSYKAFDWFWKMLKADKLFPGNFHFFHAGRCGRCGRMLTVPDSIEIGLGPECAQM